MAGGTCWLLPWVWLVSGLWVKHSTASPCPWLCQPQRKGADISAFVHFMSIYGHLGSLLALLPVRHNPFPPEQSHNLQHLQPSPGRVQDRAGRRFLHQEVFEKQGLVLESWDCLSTLPVPWPLQGPACDSLSHAETRAPLQRLQEEGTEP